MTKIKWLLQDSPFRVISSLACPQGTGNPYNLLVLFLRLVSHRGLTLGRTLTLWHLLNLTTRTFSWAEPLVGTTFSQVSASPD